MEARRDEDLQDLSPGLPPPSPPERCLAAALLQGFSAVSVCIAVADPGWLQVQAGGQVFVYGVAYVLHSHFNVSDPGSHLLQKSGYDFLILMAVCCYISILVGMIAFLLDFLDTRKIRVLGVKVAAILHVVTVLSTSAAVGVCSYLYMLLLREMQLHPTKTSKDSVSFGESFFFAIFAALMSFSAAILSCFCSRKYRRQAYVRLRSPQIEETARLLQDPADTAGQGEYG
ncbi:transmembrane protein 127-like [Rhinophrynus dorsalis]